MAVVAAVAGGVFLILRASTSGGGVEIVLPTATAVPVVSLKVYITGAVRAPGVYEVKPGSRLEQVVDAAGGETEDADLEAVNLATRVNDGDHWHIPKVGEAVQPPAAKAPPDSDKIDLNSATAVELMELHGIGEIIAQRIVDYREANGPFPSVEDLLNVKGIGPTILDNNRDLVEVR